MFSLLKTILVVGLLFNTLHLFAKSKRIPASSISVTASSDLTLDLLIDESRIKRLYSISCSEAKQISYLTKAIDKIKASPITVSHSNLAVKDGASTIVFRSEGKGVATLVLPHSYGCAILDYQERK